MAPAVPDNSAEPHRQERRQHPRKKVGVKIELLVEGNAAPIRTKAADLTLGGCFVEMMFTLEIGMKLHIELWINEVKVSTEGIVVTRFRNRGNGIQFTKLAAEDRATLRQFLTAAQDSRSAK
jgi:PilZ domain